MDYAFDVISAEEHDPLRALHEPLTQALRDLVDASTRTGVDGETIRNAQSAIEAVTRHSRAISATGPGPCVTPTPGAPWHGPIR